MLRSVRRGTPTDRQQETRGGGTRASSKTEKTGIGLRREIKQGLARCNAWEVVEGRRGKKRGKHGDKRIDKAAVTRKADVPLGDRREEENETVQRECFGRKREERTTDTE
ncbi:hypothetical protein ERJ75_000619900 [Trypanosoma vivax]|nr:hypothetical protein ERJ75_000619900 [Trypanosoma vivax]